MDNNGTPMSEVIAMALAAEAIDAATAEGLTAKLGKLTVSGIDTTRFALAKQLGNMPGAFKAAGTLLEFMREAELIGLPNATPVAATMPTELRVVLPTRRPDMGLVELFTELTEHPEDADEIIGLINQQAAVRSANTKLRGSGEWAIASTGGSLNVEETLKYIRHLASQYTQPQRKWNGSWPTTIERALGRDQRVMLYPFPLTRNPREQLLVGPDAFGNDWAKQPELVHEAMIAAVRSRKLVLLTEIEVRRILSELFSDTLPGYLQEIVEEYERDKSLGAGVSRYATPEQLRAAGMAVDSFGSRAPFGGEPEHDDAWYKARLREMALAPINRPNGDIRKSRCVLTSINAAHGDVRLHDVIVLDFVQLAHGDLGGTFYMPPGRSPSLAHGDDKSVVRNLTWKNLYEKAVELGLFD